MKDVILSVHPAFVREYVGVEIEETAVDSAGYRSITQLVKAFTDAGMQLDIFRAAEYDGNLDVNPLHQTYIDPVDRDAALLEALERSDKARKEYEDRRREAIDKRQELRDDQIAKIAERLRRFNASQTEALPKADPPVSE